MELVELIKEDIFCDSSVVARKFGQKHGYVAAVIKKLQKDLDAISEDDVFNFLATEVMIREEKKEYRGREYIGYSMNRIAYMLLISRINCSLAFQNTLANLSSILLLEERVAELDDKSRESEFYKSIYLTNLALNAIDRKAPELEIHKKVVLEFGTLFPLYTFIKSEYVLPDGDKVDILAKEKTTGRDVIIELKAVNKSAHKQLRSYAVHFKNPILINVTPGKVKNKVKGIMYVTL